MPEKKNGTASATVETAIAVIDTTESSSGIGTTSATRCASGTASAKRKVQEWSSAGARAVAKRSPERKTKTAPADMPNMAIETAKNERW